MFIERVVDSAEVLGSFFSNLILHHGLTSVPVCGTIREEFLGHVQQVQLGMLFNDRPKLLDQLSFLRAAEARHVLLAVRGTSCEGNQGNHRKSSEILRQISMDCNNFSNILDLRGISSQEMVSHGMLGSTLIRTYMHTCMHACMHAYIHT